MKKIIMALPKGRILNELIPLLQKAEIVPEEDFFRTSSRKLLFNTNQKNLLIIKVRSFDVATFVALGAAQVGVAGDDVAGVGDINGDGLARHGVDPTDTVYLSNIPSPTSYRSFFPKL